MTATTDVTIEEAIGFYLEAQNELQQFRLEHAETLEALAALEDELKACQALITDALVSRDLDYAEWGGLEVLVVRTDRGAYDVERLPKRPEVMEHVELSISKSAVTKLVKRGVLSANEAEGAWVEKFAKPYVRISATKED